MSSVLSTPGLQRIHSGRLVHVLERSPRRSQRPSLARIRGFSECGLVDWWSGEIRFEMLHPKQQLFSGGCCIRKKTNKKLYITTKRT